MRLLPAQFNCDYTLPWDAQLQPAPFPPSRSSLESYGWDSYVGIAFTSGNWTQTADALSSHVDIPVSRSCVQPVWAVHFDQERPSYGHCCSTNAPYTGFRLELWDHETAQCGRLLASRYFEKPACSGAWQAPMQGVQSCGKNCRFLGYFGDLMFTVDTYDRWGDRTEGECSLLSFDPPAEAELTPLGSFTLFILVMLAIGALVGVWRLIVASCNGICTWFAQRYGRRSLH